MVFGFGKKKTQGQTGSSTQERTIQLGEIPGLLTEAESPHITDVINIAKSVKDEVETNRKKIHTLILHLESDDLNLDDIDRNLMTIVKRGKDSIVSIIKKEITSNLTNPIKYEQAILLNTEINQILKRIGDVLGLNSRIIHIFAKKYADNLKDEIAKMAGNRNRLQVAINAVENIKENCRMIIDKSEKIREERRTILQKTNRILEINTEIETLKNNIIHLERQIHDLKSKKEYAKFLEIKNKIDSLSSEKSDIKNIIDAQFSKISRPLGKYSYISSFEKPIRKMMEELVEDPYQVISPQNKGTIIQILEAVSKSVVSGAISVKDTDKSLEQIQETISRLDEFIALKESYSTKVSTLEKDLVIFDIKLLESKENDLQKAKTDHANMENLKKKLESEVNDGNKVLEKHVSEIQSGLSQVTNSKIILKI
jgi:DNA repair exonuclease SbcCD ATPase subunit